MDSVMLRSLPALSVVALAADTAEQVLRRLADPAVAAGLVEPSFSDAVVARELRYPTGLPTEVPVAIPHAEPEHVRSPGFIVATLAQPVAFGVMGSASEVLDVDLVVMLLIAEAHHQVDVLTRLVEVFQRPAWDRSLRTAANPAELAGAFDALVRGGNMDG